MMSVSFVLLEKVGRSSKLRVKFPCSLHVVGVGDADIDVVLLVMLVLEEMLCAEKVGDIVLNKELLVDPLVVERSELSDEGLDETMLDKVVMLEVDTYDEPDVSVSEVPFAVLALVAIETGWLLPTGLRDEEETAEVGTGAPYP